ncbi:MAG TPA: 1,2-phenylacetyl-CoA epoxidase subunit PaaE [Jiangellaceae bacterium]|nr:1,2-phenylacetyl-CoA epoxidase subunit PaaE [Jiangellaceae bacterium]
MTTDTRAAPASRRHSVFHRLRVSAVERLTDDAVAVTFEVPPDLRDAYAYAAGQHVNVSMPDGDEVRRSYSICSPAGSGRLRIAVKRIPDGVFSSHAMERLAPGDELDVMTPAGRFTPALDPAHAKHYVAIAAGSGITPVLSIITTVLDGEPGSRVTLVYGNRTSQSVMFLDELADLKDRHPERLHLVHVLSREDQEAELLSGRIDAERLQRFLDTLIPPETVDEWYLCGPHELVTSAREVLARRGVDRATVHAELFHVGDPPPRPAAEAASRSAAASEVTVVLDGRRSTVEISDPDESVLEAVLRVRNDAPFACKGGVCGTCRAKLLDGKVDMDRNFALEDSEVGAGYVLTCQSHPATPVVSLDYDA